MTRKRAAFAIIAVSLSLAIGMLLGEEVVRCLDGYALLRLPLVRTGEPEAPDGRLALARDLVRAQPVAEGVDPAWFELDPPLLANRAAVPEGFETVRDDIDDGRDPMLLADAFKVWNGQLIRERACAPREGLIHRLRRSTGFAFVYEPPDGRPHPPYRFYPDVTTPMGLVTNRFGWRGPDVELVKPARTIRVAFLGASTTVNSHAYPFSYPEYVGHWLELWAEGRGLDADFEILNTGREGIRSTDIAAIVRNELLPLRPDLAVYYEGSNQFRITDHLRAMEDWRRPRALAEDGIAAYSALSRRFNRAFALLTPGAGEEPPKPAYRITWPAAVHEQDPDLGNPNLPIDLPVILRDLDRIRADLASIGAELVVSSFVWAADDGMVLDPVRDRYLYNYLNRIYWPARYHDIRRLAVFQNRVLQKYATTHDLPFLDVAASMPLEPALFTDGVHMTPEGLRLRSWITAQLLIPVLADRIASGRLPRADDRPPATPAPELEILRSDLQCRPSVERAASTAPGRS